MTYLSNEARRLKALLQACIRVQEAAKFYAMQYTLHKQKYGQA